MKRADHVAGVYVDAIERRSPIDMGEVRELCRRQAEEIVGSWLERARLLTASRRWPATRRELVRLVASSLLGTFVAAYAIGREGVPTVGELGR